MEAFTAYRTTDDKIFVERQEAIDHEKDMELKKELSKLTKKEDRIILLPKEQNYVVQFIMLYKMEIKQLLNK